MSESTATVTTTTTDRSEIGDIPIFVRRFKNLDKLLVRDMATYALPEAHKGVSRFRSIDMANC